MNAIIVMSYSYTGDCFIAIVKPTTGEVLAMDDGYAQEELPDLYAAERKLPIFSNL